ncbi:MAG: response regulator [bacterium]|nr:response regulator [bacterium]MDZ4284479.1 response regulator [Patescibacteria group bacterium]
MGNQLTVFFIEDDPYIAHILSDSLVKNGFAVMHVGDGEEALKLADNSETMKTVAIVLLDLLLPNVHGFEVLKRLKANEASRDIPVIILTNIVDQEMLKESKRLGAADYLVKAECSTKEIIARINVLLHRSTDQETRKQ